MKESELEDTLSKISNLAAKINVKEVEKDSQAILASSEELLKRTEKAGVLLPEVLDRLNKTASSVDSEEKNVQEAKDELADFMSKNEVLKNDVKDVI